MELAGRDPTTAFVAASPRGDTNRMQVWAPIAADGTFALLAAPAAAIDIGVATQDGRDASSFVAQPWGAGAAPVPPQKRFD